MARKSLSNRGKPSADETEAFTPPSTTTRAPSRHLGRRAYLKTGIAAAATATGVMGMTGAVSADDDFETIVLDEGEQRRYSLANGETFENVLIDQTADQSMFYIAVEEGANDWAIRNIGWKGLAPTGSGNREGTFLIHAQGDGEIENIFIDQRNHHGGAPGSDVGGIWTYSDSHFGHIECSHNFIAGCGNNASYDSGEGWNRYEGDGSVSHHQSYHRDNTPSNFRPGLADSTVTSCVSIANDPDGKRGTYPASDSQYCRAVWGWHNPGLTVEDSAFWWDPSNMQAVSPFWATHRGDSDGEYCELTIANCDINDTWENAGYPLVEPGHGEDADESRQVTIENMGYSPSVEILGDGVPLTPEMAARGERALPPELGTAPGAGEGEPDDEQGSEFLSQSPADEQSSNGSSPDDDTGEQSDPDSTPVSPGMRFGLLGAMATVGGAGYAIKRRFQDEDGWNVTGWDRER